MWGRTRIYYVYKFWAFLWSLILSMWGEAPYRTRYMFLHSALVLQRGAATAEEQPWEAPQVRTTLTPKPKALGGKSQIGDSALTPGRSSHHHLHPYQPGQMFQCNILSQHTEVKDTGRLWESNFISKCYKYLTMPIKANEWNFGIVWNEHQCSAPEKYYLT